jgi:hypothetical protein
MISNRKLKTCIAGIGFALCVMLMCLASVSAATFAEYRKRVSEGLVAVQQLQLYSVRGNSLSERSRETTVARLRTLLPAKETVLFESQNIEVDNSWLHDALDQYEKSLGGHGNGNEVLTRAGERLLAIGQRLDEIQKGTKTFSKDEEKGRLAEILRRPEYQKEAAEGSAIGRLWDRFMRWLASLFPKAKPIQRGSSRLISGIAQILVIVIALALIGFLIWKFLPRYLRNRTKKKPKREVRIVLGERLEPDQTAADLLAQAEALARSGDLRAAIRKAYIAFLCELGDRKVISLAQHKTNRDYLNSVGEKGSLYATMRGLTNSFEVHWYGFVPPGENDWNDFRQRYQQALKTPSG